jgi:hypothetical protein
MTAKPTKRSRPAAKKPAAKPNSVAPKADPKADTAMSSGTVPAPAAQAEGPMRFDNPEALEEYRKDNPDVGLKYFVVVESVDGVSEHAAIMTVHGDMFLLMADYKDHGIQDYICAAMNKAMVRGHKLGFMDCRQTLAATLGFGQDKEGNTVFDPTVGLKG